MGQIDTGTDELLARVDDGVGVITMNRPERRNALSPAMLGALGATLAAFELDADVGCVVLTGAGGAFCSGGDMKARNEAISGRSDGPTPPLDVLVHRQRLQQRATAGRLYEMPKPTLAALPGPAAGAGMSLALACDLRYAVDTAVFTTAFARVGFAGDYGGTWFLTRLVGPSRAKELYYTSPRLSAAEAERLGLLNGVFAAEAFETAVMEIARRLAAGPRVAYRYMKENINRAVHGELGDCLDMEATHHIATGLTEDHREAVAAFVERREPVFRGR